MSDDRRSFLQASVRRVFPTATPELAGLLAASMDGASLALNDLYTLRDWLEISECPPQDELLALLALLMLALDEGSLCVTLEPAALRRRLGDLIDDAAADAWVPRLLAAVEAQDWSRLVGASADDARPVILHRQGTRRYLYFQKYLLAEIDFQARFGRRLQIPPTQGDPKRWSAILREVLDQQPLMAAGAPMRPDDDQQAALGMALNRGFALISGGPGTGKTAIVVTLLRCLVRGGYAPEQIALAAPTGRAAQRLTDALRAGLASLTPLQASPDTQLLPLAATTLHQLLGYNPALNLYRRHVENPIPADIVIVDEVSMVGLVLMAQLLGALRPTTKLILLGDKDQLPSVDAGAVLAHLVPAEHDLGSLRSLRDHVVLLRTNHRSQPAIRAAAQAINAQDIGVIERVPSVTPPREPQARFWRELESQGGCWLWEQQAATVAELKGILDQWIWHSFLGTTTEDFDFVMEVKRCVIADEEAPEMWARVQRLFRHLERTRLLTLIREGPWGCEDINRYCEQMLRPRLDAESRGLLFAGAPVLITRNDPVRQLYNGDVGLTLRSSGGGLRVVFPRANEFLTVAADTLPPHELGYALTVHKSQGSEYGQVLVMLPPSGGRRLLTKELVYTAITRAKHLAILCGTKDALCHAISRRVLRESGLLNWNS
jgi:exodeoxyribonuclease V alpha subunit